MSDREAMSELSQLVCEGAGYDEVFSSRREPEEDSPPSPERELSTQSLSDENEEEDKGDAEVDDEGEKDDEDREDKKEDGGARPFILPAIWTINDFYPMMTSKVFNTLRELPS